MSQDSQVADQPAGQALVVWCADAAAAAPLLTAIGPVDLRSELPAGSAEATAMPATLLLYLAPREVLCRAMTDGIAPAAALEAWRSDARALLALSRRDRRRVRLAEIGAARANPAAFAAALGLDAAPDPAPPDPRDALLDLLAGQTLAGDATTRAMAAELEAASLDLTGGTGGASPDPEEAFRSLTDLRQETVLLRQQNRSMREEMETLAEGRAQDAETARRAALETELLQAQNRSMQEEMETLARGRLQLEQRLAQLNQGLESYQSQVGDLRDRQAALGRRLAEKEQGLLDAGRQIRDLEAYGAELRRAIARGQQERAAAEAELQRLLASRAWRLTAPLRRIRLLISGRRPV